MPYDTTQPYRHGMDTPGRSVPVSPERSSTFLPSAYNEPDPPPAANYFAEEEEQQQERARQHLVRLDDTADASHTPTLDSSSTAASGQGVATPVMSHREALARPDHTPRQMHAPARGS